MEVFSNLFREMEDFSESTKAKAVAQEDVFKTTCPANMFTWHIVVTDNRT